MDDKIRDRLQRNRLAATKHRKKKNDGNEHLKLIGKEVERRHLSLAADAAALRDEVLVLKNELLRHGSCNNELINMYIEDAAKRFA